jgi:hypothetical protein
MRRQLIDRMADTTAFRVLLALSALMVLPVLALGLFFAPIALVASFLQPDAGSLAFALLALGGAMGRLGGLRARWGARTPDRHNVGLTLALVAIGIATAFAVGSFVAYFAITLYLTPWGWTGREFAAAAAFVVAHGVWIVSGIASIERLTFSYAVRTGRIFDPIPITLLLLALGLALAVVLAAATLA